MIPIGVVGRIVSGDEQGRFVVVQDDRAMSKGYLIITGDDREFLTNGFDDWVDGLGSLEAYALARHWVVDWDPEST
jgi:hypothetical protein